MHKEPLLSPVFTDILDRFRPERNARTDVLHELAKWDDKGNPGNAAARELDRRNRRMELGL